MTPRLFEQSCYRPRAELDLLSRRLDSGSAYLAIYGAKRSYVQEIAKPIHQSRLSREKYARVSGRVPQ